MKVMLKPSWPGVFGRTIRDASGDAVNRLEFTEGAVVDLDAQELASCADDIGKSLVLVRFDDDGTAKADLERTAAWARGERVEDAASEPASDEPHESRSHRRRRR